MTQDARLNQLTGWVNSLAGWQHAVISVASEDASFRRYFRVTSADHSAIVMDSPPDKEDCRPFVDINQRLISVGVHAPKLYAQNLLDGFLLLEDLGQRDYLSQLSPETADHLYQDALQTLLKVQTANVDHLPEYDEDWFLREMAYMPEWFLATHLGLRPEEIPTDLINSTFQRIADAATKQPQVFVHRDYHSRNLMYTEPQNPGVIDHQGAVFGPMTYDLVSLLRDCYIVWPEQRVEKWALAFHKEAINAGTIPPVTEQQFMRWFDLIGIQRHLKVLGLFCRLHHRDGKARYLNDLPLVLNYILSIGKKHPETSQLIAWMHETGIPHRIQTSIKQLNGAR